MNTGHIKNFNYNHLYYFHVTASQGSIKQASEFLGITQPTISEQLQKLEQNIGVELFNRNNRNMQLSQEGEKVFQYTTKIFGLSEEMILGFHYQNYSNKLKQIKIGISESIPKNLVTHLFTPLFKGLDFSIYFSASPLPLLKEKLKRREIDFFLGEATPNHPIENFETTLIYEPKISLVTGSGIDRLSSNNFKSQLENIPYFKFPGHNSFQRLVDRYFLQERFSPHVLGESDDIDMICSFLSANESFATIPYAATQKYENLKEHFPLSIEAPRIFGHLLEETENDFAREILMRLVGN